MSSSLQKNDDNDKSVPINASDDLREEAASVPVKVAFAASAYDKPLSKSQMKRQGRWEQAMQRKKRRKQQEKEIKVAKALAEGRDLEEERRLLEERTKGGVGHQRREEKWMQRMKLSAEASFRVCIDCAFNDQMTVKELNSLALQIRYCYSCNRKSDNPVYFSVAGLAGHTRELLEKVEGFPEQWSKRAFNYSEKSLVEMHPDKSKLVYLTSDSENTLQHLENDKIYVIGGIVDRNRLKCAAIGRAESVGIATAKLPITDFLDLVTTKVLTCNHVFEILLKYRHKGNDWKMAMLDVLPNRKGVQPRNEGKKDKHEKDEAHALDHEADERTK
jgi:tRNA (guanine9-N1)-methyltransferase